MFLEILLAYAIIIVVILIIGSLLYVSKLEGRYILVIICVGFTCLSIAVWEMIIFPAQGWSEGPMLQPPYIICISITICSAFFLFLIWYSLKNRNIHEIVKMGLVLFMSMAIFGMFEDFYCWVLHKLYYGAYPDNNVFDLFVFWLNAHPFFYMVFPMTGLFIGIILWIRISQDKDKQEKLKIEKEQKKV